VIGYGRLTFEDAGWGEIVGTFSVDATGWVTKWADSNVEVAEAMYPPAALISLAFTDPAPKPQPVVTDDAVQAFGEVLLEHDYDVAEVTRVSETEIRYEQPGVTPARETVRAALAAALAAAFAEVGL
jgi:hypothetical protein